MAEFDPDAYLAGGDEEVTASEEGFDPDQYLAEEEREPGIVESAINWLESYTGAPTRAAVDAAASAENPFSAFAKQWGEDPKTAPTSKQISEKLGVPGTPVQIGGKDVEISPTYNPYGAPEDEVARPWAEPAKIVPSEVTGFIGDMGLDWTNTIGTGLYKGTGRALMDAGLKGIGKFGKYAAKIPAKGGAIALDTALGQKTAQESVESLADYIVPKVADDWDKMAQIARDNGLDPDLLPSSVRYGDESFLTKADRSVAEGPIGEPIRRKWNAARDSVDTALDNRIKIIGEGDPLNQIEAGNFLRESFDKARKGFFEQMDWTYSTVYNQVPGMKIHPMAQEILESRLAGMKKYAKGVQKRAIGKAEKTQAAQIFNAINGIENSKNYKQMYEALQRIRKYAFPKRGEFSLSEIKPDIENMRELYFAVQKSLVDTARFELGPNIANQLEANNKAMVQWFNDEKLIEYALNPDVAGEDVFRQLVLNGDSKQLAILKKRLPKDDVNRLKGSFLQSLLKPGPDRNTLLGSLRKSLAAKDNQLNALFSTEEINRIQDLVELGERVGPYVNSTSGTGTSNAFRNLLANAWDGILTSSIVNPMKKAAESGEVLRKNPELYYEQIPQYLKRNFGTNVTVLSDSPKALGMKAATGASRALNMQGQREEEKKQTIPPMLLPPQSKNTLEGFDPAATVPVDPMQTAALDMEIKSSPMSNIEKAKKLQLLRKHGRVALDP